MIMMIMIDIDDWLLLMMIMMMMMIYGGHFSVSLTIIRRECVGYEMVQVDNQQGA